MEEPSRITRLYQFGALFAVFCIVGLGVNYPGLDAPMYYDSSVRLEWNKAVFEYQGLSKVLAIFPQRPVTMTSFYLNYLATGMNAAAFRVVNVMVLACASLLVVLLINMIREINETSSIAGSREMRMVSVALGAFFLVHPLQSCVTLYIWQRAALLACLFYFAALAVYLAVRTRRTEHRVAGYALCVVLYFLAVMSKENAVTLPAVLIVAEIGLLRSGWKATASRASIFGVVLLGLVFVMSLFEAPHGKVELGSGIGATISNYYGQARLTAREIVFTQCRVWFTYLSMIVVPLPSHIHLISPQIISDSLLTPSTTLPAVMGIIGSVVASVWFLSKRPILGFGLLFFGINLLPEAVLVPQFTFFGYRAVLPMLGILLALSDLISVVRERLNSDKTRRLFRATVAGLLCAEIIVAAVASVEKAQIWRVPLRFWTDAAALIPSDIAKTETRLVGGMLNNLGIALRQNGMKSEAVRCHEKALILLPEDVRLHFALALAYWEASRTQDAEASLNRALELDPRHAQSHFRLGQILISRKDFDGALDHLRTAVDLSPQNETFSQALGSLLTRRGDLTGAESVLRRSLELNPRSAMAHGHMGSALVFMGKSAEALFHLNETVRINPNYGPAYNDLGLAYVQMKKLPEAVRAFKRALEINPQDSLAKTNLEAALQDMAPPATQRTGTEPGANR